MRRSFNPRMSSPAVASNYPSALQRERQVSCPKWSRSSLGGRFQKRSQFARETLSLQNQKWLAFSCFSFWQKTIGQFWDRGWSQAHHETLSLVSHHARQCRGECRNHFKTKADIQNQTTCPEYERTFLLYGLSKDAAQKALERLGSHFGFFRQKKRWISRWIFLYHQVQVLDQFCFNFSFILRLTGEEQ